MEIIVFEECGMSKPRVRGIFGIMGHGSSHEDSHGLFKGRWLTFTKDPLKRNDILEEL